jgi:hypothetical protein
MQQWLDSMTKETPPATTERTMPNVLLISVDIQPHTPPSHSSPRHNNHRTSAPHSEASGKGYEPYPNPGYTWVKAVSFRDDYLISLTSTLYLPG